MRQAVLITQAMLYHPINTQTGALSEIPPQDYYYSYYYYYYYYTLRMRRHRLDALFLTPVYFVFKFCPSIVEIVGLQVPAWYIRDFALFNVCSSCKNCPSVRCASAANVVCRDVDVFGAGNVHLNHFYNML
jgi:hypothetical protein